MFPSSTATSMSSVYIFFVPLSSNSRKLHLSDPSNRIGNSSRRTSKHTGTTIILEEQVKHPTLAKWDVEVMIWEHKYFKNGQISRVLMLKLFYLQVLKPKLRRFKHWQTWQLKLKQT